MSTCANVLSFAQMCCVRMCSHEDASMYAYEHARAHDGYNGGMTKPTFHHVSSHASHDHTNFCNAVYNRERERERENKWFNHVHSYKFP
jgi:hypothetical protein